MAARSIFPLGAATDFGSQAFSGLLAGEDLVRREAAQSFLQELQRRRFAMEEAEEGRKAKLFPLQQQGAELDLQMKRAPVFHQAGRGVMTSDRLTGKPTGTEFIPMSDEESSKLRREEAVAAKVHEFRERYATASDQERPALIQEYLPYIGNSLEKVIAEGVKVRRPKVNYRQGAGDTFAITEDPDTSEQIGQPRPLGIGAPESKGAFTRGDIEAALKEKGWTAEMPGYRNAYLSVARQVQVAPGGAAYGGDVFVPNVPGGAPTPPAPSVSRPAMPNPGEREDLASLDATESALQHVIKSLKTEGGLGDVMGGVFKNPSGARRRVTEEYLGFGMTDEQRKTMGTLAIQLQAIKHALIGATRTRPELADIAAAIPDEKSLLKGDSTEQAAAKLEATLADLQNRRRMRENAMRSSGVAVPARPSGPVTTPGSGLDIVRRANEIAKQRFGQPYGSLDEPTRKAIFQEVTGGR